MLALQSTSLVPPRPERGFLTAFGHTIEPTGQWWLYVTETDMWLFAGDYNALREIFVLHLAANRLPIPADPDAEMQNRICAMLPVEWKGCAVAGHAPPSLNLAAVRRFVAVMGEMAVGREFVSHDEAERRAGICAQCRFNVPLENGGCAGCGTVAGFVMKAFGDYKKTSHEEQLQNCGFCGCYNSLLVNIPADILQSAYPDLTLPTDIRQDGSMIPCWRRG